MTGGAQWTAPGEGTARPLRRPEPRYTRLGALGSGAMGTVHLGWDAWLERNVALKVPVGAPGSAAEHALQREATLAARLDHPSIAAIHDVGTDASGQPFFVMRLVRGQTLAELVARDPGSALRAVRVAADAVAHAHEQRIVHRDLSPRNVLVGAHGDVAIIDWGVAAEAGDRDAPRGVGTPGFAAPEQLAGASPDVTADVWSLGALLALATGDEAPPEVAAIIDRATATQPAARYPDAGGLAADLAAWEDGRRVGAYRYSRADLVRRAARAWRGPLLALATAVTLLAAQITWSALRVRDERDRAVDAEKRALRALATANTQVALAAWKAGDDVEAAKRADDALQAGEDPVAMGIRLATANQPAPIRQVLRPTTPCGRLRLPADGRVALCFEPHTLTVTSIDGPAWQLDASFVDARVDGDLIYLLDPLRHLTVVDVHDGAVHDTDGRPGEFAQSDRPVRFDPDRRHPLDDAAWQAPCAVHGAVARAEDGARWVACGDGSVWRLTDGPEQIRAPGPEIIDMLAAVDGGVWGATHHGELLELTGTRTATLGEPPARLQAVPGRPLVLAQGRLGRLRLLHTRTGRWSLDLGRVDAAAVAGPDSVLVQADGALQRVPIPATLPTRSWRLPHGVSAVAWGPHGVITGDGIGRVHHLDPTGARPDCDTAWQDRVVKAVDAWGDDVAASAMGADGLSLLSRDLTQRKAFPELQSARLRRIVTRADDSLIGAAYGPALYRVERSGVVTLLVQWTVHDLAIDPARELAVFTTDAGVWQLGQDDAIRQLYPDAADHVATMGPRLATATGASVTVREADAAQRWEQGSPVTDVVWLSPDRLATGGLDGVIRVYARDGALLAALPAHDDRVGALAVSADGRHLVSGGWDGRVQILDLEPLGR